MVGVGQQKKTDNWIFSFISQPSEFEFNHITNDINQLCLYKETLNKNSGQWGLGNFHVGDINMWGGWHVQIPLGESMEALGP